MADLSNLLGDVYGDAGDGGKSDVAPQPPAWADESRLDEAFADWTPEPLERVVAKVPSSAPLDDDLAAALSAALAEAPRPAAPVDRFVHVNSSEPVEPAVLDAATLEPVPEPVSDPVASALDAIVVTPPAPVAEAKRRGLSFSRRPRQATVTSAPASLPLAPPAPVDTVEAGTAPRTWQRGDDDILPPRSAARKSINFRLR